MPNIVDIIAALVKQITAIFISLSAILYLLNARAVKYTIPKIIDNIINPKKLAVQKLVNVSIVQYIILDLNN